MVYNFYYLINHTARYITRHNLCQIDIRDRLEVVKLDSNKNLIKLKNLVDYEYYFCDAPEIMWMI